MRLLYICNEYPPAVHGGIGIFVRTLAERLAAAGHTIAVIGFASHVRDSKRAIENGVCVVRLPWPQYRGVVRLGGFRVDPAALAARKSLARQAARFASEFQPGVVESHDWSGPLWTPPWRPWIVRLHGASSVHAWSRGRRAGRLMRLFERRNLRLADAIVSPSQFIARTTFAALSLGGKRVEVVHHGVDCERFRPEQTRRDPNEVLFAGTVKRRKGILELFQAIPRIAAEVPEAHFTVAGRYPDDPRDPCSLRALLGGLPEGLRGGLRPGTDRVRFLGQVEQADLAGLYSRAAVAVFPSHEEAFGLACAEAMASGAAIVMTARGSGPELIEHGESGLIVDPTDVTALSSAVVRLLQDAALRRRLGAAGRARALERFNLNRAAEGNVAFYEKVLRRFESRQRVHA